MSPCAWRYLIVSENKSTNPPRALFDDHVTAVSGDAKGQVLEVEGGFGSDVGFWLSARGGQVRDGHTLTESQQHAVDVPPQHEHWDLA